MLIKYTVPHELASASLPVRSSGSRFMCGGAYSTGIRFIAGELQEVLVRYTDKRGIAEKCAYLCLEDYEAEVTIGSSRRSIEAKAGDILFPYSPYPVLSFEVEEQ